LQKLLQSHFPYRFANKKETNYEMSSKRIREFMIKLEPKN